MNRYDWRHLRNLAIATLATLGGVVLSVLLTLAFPTLGMRQSDSALLYLPPQAYFELLLVPCTVVCAFAASISGLRQSRRARQPRWAMAFTVILLLLVLFPVVFICSFSVGWSVFALVPTLQDFGQQPASWWLLAGVAAAVVALAGGCALAYAAKAGAARGARQGRSARN